MQTRPDDFRKFYLTKVGLGEGCGCAERIIDMHELSRRAATPDTRPYRESRGKIRDWLRWLLARDPQS